MKISVDTLENLKHISVNNLENLSTYKLHLIYFTQGRLSDHAGIQRGEQGARTPPPLKNHKNMEFLSNTGSHPLKRQARI